MKVKRTDKGNLIVRIDNADMVEKGVANALLWAVLTMIAAKRPDLVGPVVAAGLRLDGELIMEIQINSPMEKNGAIDPNLIVGGFVTKVLSTKGDDNGAVGVEVI